MGSRLAARLLDGLIIGIPAAILLVIAGINVAHHTTCTTDPDSGFRSCQTNGGVGALGLVYLLVFVGSLAYDVLFIGLTGATPGKRIMGARVQDATSGQPIGVGRAIVRALVLAATGAICFIGYFSPFFDNTKRNQGWQDKAANDFVVSTR